MKGRQGDFLVGVNETKILYCGGLFCFFLSFFIPATPAQVVEPNYDKVKVWESPLETHFNIALEPVGEAIDYFFNDIKNYEGPDDLARDNFNRDELEKLQRFFYSLPASAGWFSIWFSLVAICFLKSTKKLHVGRFFRIAGTTLLIAAPLLSLDFYKTATLWEGHFFLMGGAYLFVSAYILLGTSFWFLSNRSAAQDEE